MELSKIILNMAEVVRPVITKLLPAKLLSSMKAKVIYKAGQEIDVTDIKTFERNRFPDGINLIASIKSDTGLGQSARLKAETIEKSGIEYSIFDFVIPPGGSRKDKSYDHKISDKLPYNINLIHVNASEMSVAYLKMGQDVWNYRYNIGFWAWELEEFPKEWIPSFKLVDELWTPSAFVTNTLKKYTDKPVITIPHCVSAPTNEVFNREYFQLPDDKFLVLIMFDSGSSMERKNPIAAIKAFHEAFGSNNPNVGLVIKINEPELSEKDLQIINHALYEQSQFLSKEPDDKQKLDENIYVITGTYSKIEVNSMIACVDAYISLHRAEGFGLVLAEAMFVGTPVIATNWSANTEFMNSDVACMVDYKMVRIPDGVPPFPQGFLWADADVIQAASYMKRLYEEQEFYDEIKNNAMEFVREKLSVHTIAELVKERTNQILNNVEKEGE